MIVTRQYTYGWTTSPKPAAVAVTVGEGWWWSEREAADEVSQSSNFFWMSLADVHRVGSVIQSNWRFNRVQLLSRGEKPTEFNQTKGITAHQLAICEFILCGIKVHWTIILQVTIKWSNCEWEKLNFGSYQMVASLSVGSLSVIRRILWGDKRFLGSNGGIWEEEIRRRRMKDKIGNKLVQVEFLWNKTTLRWNDWPGATNCVPNWTE